MASKQISGLTALTGVASGDQLLILDVSSPTEAKSVTVQELFTNTAITTPTISSATINTATINTATLPSPTITTPSLTTFSTLYGIEGSMINGRILPTVSGNNLTLSLKTFAGTDPSSSDPVYAIINGAVRTVTSALSSAKNAGTNWANAGAVEFAAKEMDWFAYLGYNATDGVTIGFSRFPGAIQYGDFSATTTNEKYCAISTITNAASTDYYTVIGRFAATLSGTAAFNWSVPTYTAANLIQRPIYKSRKTAMNVTTSVGSGFLAMTATVAEFIVDVSEVRHWFSIGGTSNSTGFSIIIPFAPAGTFSNMALGAFQCDDNSARLSTYGKAVITPGSVTVPLYATPADGGWTAANTKKAAGFITYNIS